MSNLENANLSDIFDEIQKANRTVNKNRIDQNSLLRELTELSTTPIKGKTASERIRSAEANKKELENKDKQQDIELKKTTSRFLFILLTIETITIFTIVFLKGFNVGGFNLGDTTLDIITSATLIQVAYMVTIVVSYLFPKNSKSKS